MKLLTNLFGGNFNLTNMKGRPVFIRTIGAADYKKFEVAVGHMVDVDDILCDDCGKTATLLIHELDGDVWSWCGECDQGG